MAIRLTPPVPRGADRGGSTAGRAAGVLLGIQALLLVGFVAFYLWEIAIGASDDLVRAIMSMLLIALGAVGLALLARAWLRGDSWPRTGTIVWCVLLLPVTVSLVQSGRLAWGVSVGAIALCTITAAVLAPAPEH